MSLAMYQGETSIQVESMNELCEEMMQAAEQVNESIDFFLGASLLQGKTYQSAKLFMSATYRPIAQGIIYLCQELIQQNNKYPRDFTAQVSGADVVEDEIHEQIKEIDKQIEGYKLLADVFPLQTFPIIGLQMMKASLQKKLENLYAFNTTSSNNYNLAVEYTDSIFMGLSQITYSTNFNSVSGIFNTDGMDLSFIANIEHTYYKRQAYEKFAEYLKKHPDDVDKVAEVMKYEDDHPEDKEATSEFLSPLDEKDTMEIKFLMYTAEEPYRSLVIQYLDRINLNPKEIVDEEDPPPSSFSHRSNTINYVYETDRENSRGEYFTIFHEIGHAVDYNYGIDEQNQKSTFDFTKRSGTDAFYSEYFEHNEETLADKMHADFNKQVGDAVQNELNSPGYDIYNDAQKDEMNKNVMMNINNRDKYFDSLIFDEQGVQMTVEDEFAIKLNASHDSLASDVYGGVSDNTIDGRFGHPDGYWYNWLGFRKREPNREGFAEYFARQVMYSDDSDDKGIKSAEEFLPTSKKMMDDMFETMKKE